MITNRNLSPSWSPVFSLSTCFCHWHLCRGWGDFRCPSEAGPLHIWRTSRQTLWLRDWSERAAATDRLWPSFKNHQNQWEVWLTCLDRVNHVQRFQEAGWCCWSMDCSGVWSTVMNNSPCPRPPSGPTLWNHCIQTNNYQKRSGGANLEGEQSLHPSHQPSCLEPHLSPSISSMSSRVIIPSPRMMCNRPSGPNSSWPPRCFLCSSATSINTRTVLVSTWFGFFLRKNTKPSRGFFELHHIYTTATSNQKNTPVTVGPEVTLHLRKNSLMLWNH